MAATASNTELPGTAVVIMTSLGPDWRHDKLCRCYGVPDLLQVPSPSSCGWVLNRYRFSRHCFGFNVTVCAPLLFTRSWVRSLLLLTPERCSRWQHGTALNYRYSESRSYHAQHSTAHFTHFVIHFRKFTRNDTRELQTSFKISGKWMCHFNIL